MGNRGQADQFYLNVAGAFGTLNTLATHAAVAVPIASAAGLGSNVFADTDEDGLADPGTLANVIQQAVDAALPGFGLAVGDVVVAIAPVTGPTETITLRSGNAKLVLSNTAEQELLISTARNSTNTAELDIALNLTLELARGSDTQSIVIGNVDGVGRNDVVVGTFGGEDLLYVNNETADPFTTAPVELVGGVTSTTALLLADVAGSAALDVLAVSGGDALRIYTNPITAATPAEVAVGAQGLNVAAGPFLRLEANNAALSIEGQRLSGDFFFEQINGADGNGEVTVAFNNVSLDIQGGGASIDVSSGQGIFLLREQGIAGRAEASVNITASDVVVSGGTFALSINTLDTAVNLATPIRGSPLVVNLPAGPFLRVEGTELSIDLTAGAITQSLTGDFAFEERTLTGSPETVIAVGLSNISLIISDANVADPLFEVTDGSGAFAFTPDGVVGRASATIAVDPSPGISLSGNFSVAFNTTSSAQTLELELGGERLFFDIAAGPFVQVEVSGARLAVAGVELTAERFSFKKTGTTTIDVAGRNVGFVLNADAKRIIGVANANFAFTLTRAGLVGAIVAGDLLGPDLGGDVTVEGKITLLLNTTTSAADVTVVLGTTSEITGTVDVITSGVAVTDNEAAFPTALAGADLVGLRFEITNGTGAGTGAHIVSNTGTDLVLDVPLTLAADSEYRVTLVQGTPRLITGTLDGITSPTEVTDSSAVLPTVLAGGDLAGFVFEITAGTGANTSARIVSNTVTDLVLDGPLTLGTDSEYRIIVESVVLPVLAAAVDSEFVDVTVTASDDGTAAGIDVLGNLLTADRFGFTKNGNVVEISADGFAFEIATGGKRVVGLANGSAAFRIDDAGLAGAVTGASLLSPQVTDAVTLTGAVSLKVNTKTLAQTLTVGPDTVVVPAAGVGGFFVEISLARDAIAGAGSDVISGSADAVSGVTVTDASGSFPVPAAGDLTGLRFEVTSGSALGETARIVANTATELTLDAALNLVAGSEYRITDPATLGILGSTFTADRLAFQRLGSIVTVVGIDVGLRVDAGSTRILAISGADLAFTFQADGVVGFVANASVHGPDLPGITLAGDVTVLLNTTPAATVLDNGALALAIPAASDGGFVRVTLANALLGAAGSEFTAQQIVIERDGAVVDVTGTTLGLLLDAGGTRILQVTDADFAFRFSADGIIGTALNALITGPDLADVSLAGNVSLAFNTTVDPTDLEVVVATTTVSNRTLAGATQLRVTSTSGVAEGDIVSMLLSDGSEFRSVVAPGGVGTLTLTLLEGLSDDGLAGAAVRAIRTVTVPAAPSLPSTCWTVRSRCWTTNLPRIVSPLSAAIAISPCPALIWACC